MILVKSLYSKRMTVYQSLLQKNMNESEKKTKAQESVNDIVGDETSANEAIYKLVGKTMEAGLAYKNNVSTSSSWRGIQFGSLLLTKVKCPIGNGQSIKMQLLYDWPPREQVRKITTVHMGDISSWQDGLLGINCPIPPKWNWTYNFQVKNQIGSSFYFPSLYLQRASGGFGSLIINPRSIIPIPFGNPDGDIAIMIGDWYTPDHMNQPALEKDCYKIHAPGNSLIVADYGQDGIQPKAYWTRY